MTVGPLRKVSDAIDAGAVTVTEIGRTTGLSSDLVRAALDHLLRMGALRAEELTAGCPPSGCTTCASAAPATGTCGSGQVLITLSRPAVRDSR